MTSKRKIVKQADPNTIRIACKVEEFLPLSDFEDFQGELKSLTKDNYERLKNLIVKYGFIAPIFIWDGHKKILDGHQRVKTVKQMLSAEKFKLPGNKLPIVRIEADDEATAKRMVLALISQYGHVEPEGLYQFSIEADIPSFELLESFEVPDLNMPKFVDSFFTDERKGEGDESSDKPVGEEYQKMFEVVVECASESEQEKLFKRLTKEGLKCRVLSM